MNDYINVTLTPLQMYLLTRQIIAHHGEAGDLARYIAAGPPPPKETDTHASKLFYYDHYAARGDEDCARQLAQLKSEGPPQNSPFDEER